MINDIVYAALLVRFAGRTALVATRGHLRYEFGYDPLTETFWVEGGGGLFGVILCNSPQAPGRTAPEAWALLVALAFGELTEPLDKPPWAGV